MSELFSNLYAALPSDMPILTSHMWNCMGAVAGGMTNVVDMMFDNWPMAFQLTEGAKHARSIALRLLRLPRHARLRRQGHKS